MDTVAPGVADRAGDGPGGLGDDKDVPMDDIDIEALLSRTRPIWGSPQQLYEAPEFVKRLNSFEEVKAGNDVVFECQWRGFPAPTVRWYKDDEEITPEQDERCTLTPGDDGVETLRIEKARKKDEGAYKCKVENSEGVTSTTGYVSVTGDYTDKPLSAQPRKNPERAVSNAPHLRTIVEQKSLEEREQDDAEARPPSPLQTFLEEAAARQESWPVYGQVTPETITPQAGIDGLEDDSGSETSVESQDYDRLTFDLENDLELHIKEETPEPELAPDSSSESGVFSMETIYADDTAVSCQELMPAAATAPEVALPSFMSTDSEPIVVYRFISDPSEIPQHAIASSHRDQMKQVSGDVKNLPTPMEEEVLKPTEPSPLQIDEETSSMLLPFSDQPQEQFSTITNGKIYEFIQEEVIESEESCITQCSPSSHPVKDVQVVPPGDKKEHFDFPWLQYFAFTCLATFVASVTEVSPVWFIITVAILSLLSFHHLVQNVCT